MSQLKVSSVTDLSGTGSTYAPGHVVQVVSSTLTTQLAITSTTPEEVMSLAITPEFSTSKILVTVSADIMHTDFHTGFLTLFRNGVNVSPSSTRPNRAIISLRSPQGGHSSSTSSSFTPSTHTKTFLDLPASTLVQTYSLRANTSGNVLYINRSSSNADDNVNNSGFTTITLMEIAQ
jgi:hypothetical protein